MAVCYNDAGQSVGVTDANGFCSVGLTNEQRQALGEAGEVEDTTEVVDFADDGTPIFYDSATDTFFVKEARQGGGGGSGTVRRDLLPGDPLLQEVFGKAQTGGLAPSLSPNTVAQIQESARQFDISQEFRESESQISQEQFNAQQQQAAEQFNASTQTQVSMFNAQGMADAQQFIAQMEQNAQQLQQQAEQFNASGAQDAAIAAANLSTQHMQIAESIRQADNLHQTRIAGIQLQGEQLQEQIRQADAENARAQQNFEFAKRQEAVRTEEGNRTALQNATALVDQIQGRIDTLQFNRQQLVTNVQTLNAQMRQSASEFNSTMALRADEINESRRQANQANLLRVAETVGELSSNAADQGKLAGFLRAGGGEALSQAAQRGESAITDESLQPLAGALGVQRDLQQGPSIFSPERITAEQIAVPGFDPARQAPGVGDVFSPVNFDGSGLGIPDAPQSTFDPAAIVNAIQTQASTFVPGTFNPADFFQPIQMPDGQVLTPEQLWQDIQAGTIDASTLPPQAFTPSASGTPTGGGTGATPPDQSTDPAPVDRKGTPGATIPVDPTLPGEFGPPLPGQVEPSATLQPTFSPLGSPLDPATGAPAKNTVDPESGLFQGLLPGDAQSDPAPTGALPVSLQDAPQWLKDRYLSGESFGEIINNPTDPQGNPVPTAEEQAAMSDAELLAQGGIALADGGRTFSPIRLVGEDGPEIEIQQPDGSVVVIPNDMINEAQDGGLFNLQDTSGLLANRPPAQVFTDEQQRQALEEKKQAQFNPSGPFIPSTDSGHGLASLGSSNTPQQPTFAPIGPVPIDEARQFQTGVFEDTLRRGGFQDAASTFPVKVSAPGTFQHLIDLSRGAFRTGGFGTDNVFEDIRRRQRATGVRGGVVRRTN